MKVNSMIRNLIIPFGFNTEQRLSENSSIFALEPLSSTQQTVVFNALSVFSPLLVATNPVALSLHLPPSSLPDNTFLTQYVINHNLWQPNYSKQTELFWLLTRLVINSRCPRGRSNSSGFYVVCRLGCWGNPTNRRYAARKWCVNIKIAAQSRVSDT